MNNLEQDPPDIRLRTYDFALRVVKLSQVLDSAPGISRTLSNQLLRSGTSIGANVEEAKAGHSKADFIAKLTIACKEARETNYWLRLLSDAEIVGKERLEPLTDESNQIITILTTIIKNSRRDP